MRLFFIILLTISELFGAAKVVEVNQRYQSSKNCKVCHHRIVDEWHKSWHSRSYYKSDEYFQKSLAYIAKKSFKSLNSVKVKCATCHNPRITVTSTGEDYEIASVMGLTKGSAVDKAVNDKALSEGINCVVCHNIAKIHNEYDASKRGMDRVEWTPSGTMTGPYSDAKSPYHKIIHHEFMDKNPNELCFVCHANDRSVHGLVFTNMQQEYQKSYKKGTKSCVECHMGAKRRDLASTYKMYNGKAKMRDVRDHSFAGAHISSMWKNALELKLNQKSDNIFISIYNPQPHNIPSGFGSRELLIKVLFYNDARVINRRIISLTRKYRRERGRVATSHLAKKESKDLSIPAYGKRVLEIKKVSGATRVRVELDYVLVNAEIRSLLKLQDKIWSKEYFITKRSMILE